MWRNSGIQLLDDGFKASSLLQHLLWIKLIGFIDRIWQYPKDIQGPTNDHSNNIKIPGGTKAATICVHLDLWSCVWPHHRFGVFSSLPVCLWPPLCPLLRWALSPGYFGNAVLAHLEDNSKPCWISSTTFLQFPFPYRSPSEIFSCQKNKVYLLETPIIDCQSFSYGSQGFSAFWAIQQDLLNIAVMQLQLGFDAGLIGIPAGLRAWKCDTDISLHELSSLKRLTRYVSSST